MGPAVILTAVEQLDHHKLLEQMSGIQLENASVERKFRQGIAHPKVKEHESRRGYDLLPASSERRHSDANVGILKNLVVVPDRVGSLVAELYSALARQLGAFPGGRVDCAVRRGLFVVCPLPGESVKRTDAI